MTSTTPRRGIAALSLSLATLLLAPGVGRAEAPTSDATGHPFDQAMAAYGEQRFAAAYGRLIRLADRGHAEAARIAWFMHRHARSLYGNDWDATPEQLQRWSQQVMQAARTTEVAALAP